MLATWCSFCSAEEASGELVIGDDQELTMPVCDTCVHDNYDENVLPVLLNMGNYDAG